MSSLLASTLANLPAENAVRAGESLAKAVLFW
jgi:hypothetical protein